jgi:hypothetical protein
MTRRVYDPFARGPYDVETREVVAGDVRRGRQFGWARLAKDEGLRVTPMGDPKMQSTDHIFDTVSSLDRT